MARPATPASRHRPPKKRSSAAPAAQTAHHHGWRQPVTLQAPYHAAPMALVRSLQRKATQAPRRRRDTSTPADGALPGNWATAIAGAPSAGGRCHRAAATTGAEGWVMPRQRQQGWRERDDGHGRRGIRAASGDAAATPDHARAGCSNSPNAKKTPAIAEIAGAKTVRREKRTGPRGQETRETKEGALPAPQHCGHRGVKPDQQPLGRPVRMGTMPAHRAWRPNRRWPSGSCW